MTSTIQIAIHGASGRMGQALLHAAREYADAEIVAALVQEGSSWDGQRVDGGELTYSAILDTSARVLVDFSAAQAFDRALALARERGLAFVSGTTGLSAAQFDALAAAAREIPVVWASNFSLGIAVLLELVRTAAGVLPDWDCEIAETHHRHKKDAPSGTALALGRAIAAARGVDFEAVARFARHGVSDAPRVPREIGFSALRAGDVIGDHQVVFATSGERIELSHRASDRNIYARGALHAACALAGKAPGRYELADLLR